MLDDKQKDALRKWYTKPEILDEARGHIKRQRWEDLEELLHMRALFPLGRIKELPDYLKLDDGSALLPSLNPGENLEAWQDAIEIGWGVVQANLSVSRDEVHQAIGQMQQQSWDDFMKSVEERKQKRQQ
jgi:hypothetical protein